MDALLYFQWARHTLCRLDGIGEISGLYSCDVDPLIYSFMFVFLSMTKGFRDNEKLCFFICHSFVTDCVHMHILQKLIVTETYALAHCLSPQGRRASAAPSLVHCRTPFVSRAVTAVTIGHVWVQRRIRWKTQIPVCLLDPASALAHLLLHL